jgi:hypothetical protein
MKSRAGSVANLLFIDLLGSIAYFPVWWYSKGLSRVVGAAIHALRYRKDAYALSVWIRNFFVPMYGQVDWAGRLISVFMRFVVILGRSIALAVEALIYLIGVFAWLATPPLAVIMAIMNGFRGIGT